MKKTSKSCQSCGMPLKDDEKGGGTNADGSRSGMYCSHCYEAGKFILPNLSVEQMQERVSQKLGEMGFPKFVGAIFTRRIPKLERWQQTGQTRR